MLHIIDGDDKYKEARILKEILLCVKKYQHGYNVLKYCQTVSKYSKSISCGNFVSRQMIKLFKNIYWNCVDLFLGYKIFKENYTLISR
jgi:hypothetical protein